MAELKKEEFALSEENLAHVSGGGSGDTAEGWLCDNGHSMQLVDYTETCPICGASEPDDGSSCVLKGTMITMADGTEKAVEDIRTGDWVRSWDFEKGTFVDAEILHPFHLEEDANTVTVIDTVFSDGTKISIANSHGFFDLNLGRYVELDKNAKAYIGHDFVKENGDGWIRVQLQEISIREERVEAYAPVTKGTINCITNGLLSIPGYCPMLYNVFDVDVTTLTWKKMEEDLKEYGLLPYEQVQHLFTKSIYDGLNVKLFSLSFGKGNCSLKDLENVMESFSTEIKKLNQN